MKLTICFISCHHLHMYLSTVRINHYCPKEAPQVKHHVLCFHVRSKVDAGPNSSKAQK